MLITNEERELFANNEKYHEIVGSERMRIKVIKPDVVGAYMKEKRLREGKSMIIELRAIVPPKKKEFNHKIKFAKDRTYGIYYGIFTGLDRFQNTSWYRILFDREQVVINLNDSEDMKQFPVIAMHPSIKGSPLDQYQDPIMEIFDPKEESMASIAKLDLIPKVTEFIKKLDARKLVNFARYIGVPVSSDMDLDMIKGDLARRGINDPKGFIDLVNEKNRNYKEVLASAIEIGEIQDDPEKGFVFNGVFLGSSKEEVIDRLANEAGLLNGVLSRIEKNDKIVIDLKNQEEKAPKAPVRKEEEEEEEDKKEKKEKIPEKKKEEEFDVD